MSVMNYKDGGKSNPEILMFGPHVVMSEASDELIETLLRKGNEIRGKEEHDFTHGLAGRIKEEYQYYGWNEWFVPLFHKHVIEYVSATPRSRSREILTELDVIRWDLKSLWVNYQKKAEYNPPHCHNGDISFVIYPSIPEELYTEPTGTANDDQVKGGNIVFEYNERHFQNFLSFTTACQNIQPHTGMIIMFPSYLTHHVYVFQQDVERVSVSGNINIRHNYNYRGT